MFEKFICPECNGIGVVDAQPQPEADFEECFYCDGTGYATDDDNDDPMYSYDKEY